MYWPSPASPALSTNFSAVPAYSKFLTLMNLGTSLKWFCCSCPPVGSRSDSTNHLVTVRTGARFWLLNLHLFSKQLPYNSWATIVCCSFVEGEAWCGMTMKKASREAADSTENGIWSPWSVYLPDLTQNGTEKRSTIVFSFNLQKPQIASPYLTRISRW